jgi:hypothetical protein
MARDHLAKEALADESAVSPLVADGIVKAHRTEILK